MAHSNSTTKLEVSPGHHQEHNKYNNLSSMKIGNTHNSNHNLSTTIKYNAYRETAAENVFYPVLNIKKAPNYLKKKA